MAPVDTSEAVIIWQAEEWVLDANAAMAQSANPCGVELHKTPVGPRQPDASQAQEGDRAHGGGGPENHQLVPHAPAWAAVVRDGT